jgi:type IV secretory pathway VirB10-like protein
VRLSLRVRRLLDDEHRPAAGARLRGASAAAATAIAAVALFAPGISAAGVDPESEPSQHVAVPATSVSAPSDADEADDIAALTDPVEAENCTDVPEPPPPPRVASVEPQHEVEGPLAATGELGASEDLEAVFAFDELAQELEELEAELGELDRTARTATPGVRVQVKHLEERLQALRALQAQLARWIDEETERAAMRSTSPSPDESTNEDLPHGGTKERR